MRVFFSASTAGREKYEKNYKTIIGDLEGRGYKVQYSHVLDFDSQKLSEVSDKYRIDYYKKLVGWISEADFIVAEVSHGSISIGHEISLSLEKGKNVIALTTKGQGPAILMAIKSSKLQLISYNLNNLHSVLDKAIRSARNNSDIRFNFFISPEISDYLDWVSRIKRIPRAVYLRELVEREIDKNKGYKSR